MTTDKNRQYVVESKNKTKSNLTTVCTNRPVGNNDSIIAQDANYVIDASPTPTGQSVEGGVTITGGQLGRNILLGTSQDDSITGGPFDDVIIGRNGSDTLQGSGGNDSFLPWSKSSSTNATIDGGLGLDSVYIDKNNQSVEKDSACNASECMITGGDSGTLSITNVEILVFKDTSIRLSDS